jgi:UPF0271 protein
MTTMNLNADVGESFGRFQLGNDEAMLKVVKSASIACGFHAGDPTIMAATVRLAKTQGVSIGARPSFDDLVGFGRREIKMNARDLEYLIAYQIGALSGIAAGAGVKVTHVKPHGALSNMAHDDPEYAAAIARAICSVDRDLIFVAIAASQMAAAGRTEGLRVAEEAFCDRTYDDDGKLLSRKYEGALIREPEQAVRQVMSFIEAGGIVTRTGRKIPSALHTFCTHGDEPTGPAVANAVRQALEQHGIRIAPLTEMAF